MNSLMQQFLSEARDFLQGIAENLMQLEKAPTDVNLLTELFRYVHTLKGNSGLFDFPEMTKVLHAAEDLLDAVRHGQVSYTQQLADHLLDAMDFVGLLMDEVEIHGSINTSFVADSVRLADNLRKLIVINDQQISEELAAVDLAVVSTTLISPAPVNLNNTIIPEQLSSISEAVRMQAYRLALAGESLYWLIFTPDEQCFFQGEDPFFQARKTPGILWGCIASREPWPKLAEMDAYRCLLNFQILAAAAKTDLADYYRYVPEYLCIQALSPLSLIIPTGDVNGGPVYEDFVSDALQLLDNQDITGLQRAAETMLALVSADLWFSSALRWLLLVIALEADNHGVMLAIIRSISDLLAPDWTNYLSTEASLSAVADQATQLTQNAASELPQAAPQQRPELTVKLIKLLAIQREILALPLEKPWHLGRMQGVASALRGCLLATGHAEAITALDLAVAEAMALTSTEPLLLCLESHFPVEETTAMAGSDCLAEPSVLPVAPASTTTDSAATPEIVTNGLDGDHETRYGRRADDLVPGAKSLKVDQEKIDRLMNLIGEMVVSKNALPYLAGRAETVFGVRELSREIKSHYTVINRIAEEMQDAIMQVRMMPVSFVFQRFSRLVRDTTRKLGKEVNLILEGEDTQADKNIIESLGDPLVHIVRNSLDHGFEMPEVRKALGKPKVGSLIIRAAQESDRVIIEIIDDGKGIDPEVVKRKAYEKGIIDEATLERISDQEAINLIFAAGFSTADVVSDLSGRGVGMDVVRTAINKVNGTIALESQVGKGTRIRLSLPLSMAVSNVMIIVSNGQIFGVPMDSVVETVRIPSDSIFTIKHAQATVLRGRIVALRAINGLLNIQALPQVNNDGELAVLVIRNGHESVGLLIDDFRETVDIILKPMVGVLAELSVYAGTALLGDGSVLMVLNPKELIQ